MLEKGRSIEYVNMEKGEGWNVSECVVTGG